MKNKKKSIAIIATALAATAACGALAILGGMPNPKKGIDDGLTSVSVPGEGGMTAAIQGGPKFAVQINATKTCTATISPANATDKTVLWATSDAAKVSIASATTQSGAAQTLTLRSVFNGTVAITAAAEANANAKVTFSVSVYNSVTTLEYVGVYDAAGGEVKTTFPAIAVDEGEGRCTLYQTGSASSPTVSFVFDPQVPDAGLNVPAVVFRAYGRDTSISPDLAASVGVYEYHTAASLGLAPVGHEAYFSVDVASDWAVGTKTFAIEDASKAVTLAAYVVPLSMAGSGNVQFK